MSQSAYTIRLDSELKNQFDSLCEDFGMSATTAFSIFILYLPLFFFYLVIGVSHYFSFVGCLRILRIGKERFGIDILPVGR